MGKIKEREKKKKLKKSIPLKKNDKKLKSKSKSDNIINSTHENVVSLAVISYHFNEKLKNIIVEIGNTKSACNILKLENNYLKNKISEMEKKINELEKEKQNQIFNEDEVTEFDFNKLFDF